MAQVLARGAPVAARTVAVGSLVKNPAFAPPVPPTPPVTERYRTPLLVILAAVLAGLAAWTIRLLRGGETAEK